MVKQLPAQKHIRVRTYGGQVIIESSDTGSEHGSWASVAVSPERVELLIKWLQEAVVELASEAEA